MGRSPRGEKVDDRHSLCKRWHFRNGEACSCHVCLLFTLAGSSRKEFHNVDIRVWTCWTGTPGTEHVRSRAVSSPCGQQPNILWKRQPSGSVLSVFWYPVGVCLPHGFGLAPTTGSFDTSPRCKWCGDGHCGRVWHVVPGSTLRDHFRPSKPTSFTVFSCTRTF